MKAEGKWQGYSYWDKKLKLKGAYGLISSTKYDLNLYILILIDSYET